MLTLLFGCDEELLDPSLDAQVPDASVDAQALPDADADGAKLAAFVAAHRDCTVDADCTIVGDCSHANFQSVARAFADEATRLVLAIAAQDGPTYNAVCRANKCERVLAAAWCGNPPQSACPDGTERRRPGCSEPAPSFTEGCFAACTAGNDAGCPAGYTCQETTVDPCGPAVPGQATCDACGMQTTLCLPAPSCEVALSVTFDAGRTVAKVASSTKLNLWLENLTDRTLTLAFDQPCHGPSVSGLGGFDVWNSCLAGACATDPVRTTVTLAPREKRLFKDPVITTAPSACNPTGLASGRYVPSFTLSAATGATTCGPAPTSLLTGSHAQ